MTPDEQAEYQQQVAAARDQLGAELFARTWASGRTLTIEEAIQFAIQTEFDGPA
jgi:hypothetical protein